MNSCEKSKVACSKSYVSSDSYKTASKQQKAIQFRQIARSKAKKSNRYMRYVLVLSKPANLPLTTEAHSSEPRVSRGGELR